MSFVHLHTHSQYSWLDGACSIDELVETAQKLKMPAVAITDRNSLAGANRLWYQCIKAGIKPIIGLEIEVLNDISDGRAFSVILLAKTLTGYRNLRQLLLMAYHYDPHSPRITKSQLRELSGGLICLSFSVVGELCTLLFEGRDAEAGQVSDWYQSVFGDDYYYEIHDHGLPREAVAMNKLLNLAYHSKIPVVLANDCHYLQRRESIAIDALNCIRKGMDFSHPDAKRFACNEYYFKTPKEMKALYSFPPDLIRNSLLIADKIELDLSETIDDGWIDQLEYYRWTPAELYRELLQVLRVPREKIVELCDLIPPEAENLAEAIEYSTDFSCLTSEDAVCSQALDIGISLANTFSRFELSDKTPWIP